MTQTQFRRVWWGFRRTAVNQLLTELAERQNQMQAEYRKQHDQLTEELAQVLAQADAGEQSVAELREEHFRLLGALDHLSQQGQMLIDQARQSQADREAAKAQEVAQTRYRLHHLRATLLNTPSHLRQLAERLTASWTKSVAPPSAEPSETLPSNLGARHVGP